MWPGPDASGCRATTGTSGYDQTAAPGGDARRSGCRAGRRADHVVSLPGCRYSRRTCARIRVDPRVPAQSSDSRRQGRLHRLSQLMRQESGVTDVGAGVAPHVDLAELDEDLDDYLSYLTVLTKSASFSMREQAREVLARLARVDLEKGGPKG